MSGGFYTRAEIQRAMDLMVGERLPGRPEQSIYEQSSLPNFAIGAKRKVDDRTFRYSEALAALAALARLVVNSNFEPGCTGHENEDGYEECPPAFGYYHCFASCLLEPFCVIRNAVRARASSSFMLRLGSMVPGRMFWGSLSQW